jgi:hypothetical protein
MLRLDLFKRRNFAVGNVETLALYGGLSALYFFMSVGPLIAGAGLLMLLSFGVQVD